MKKTKEQNENQPELPPDYPWAVTLGSAVKMIPIDAIGSTTTTQIREAYNEETIKEFERMYRSENEPGAAQLPPIVVVLAPGEKDRYWILDGHHRYTAAVRAHMTEIPASIVTPDKKRYLEVKDMSDLHFLQARENGQTIANRTTETKRRQVRAALRKRPKWTNKQLAVYCNVSFEFVDKVRTEMEKEGTIAVTKKPSEKAAEAVANPENKKKSNRQIAKETGVSEGTVRQLRKNSTSKNYAPALTPELKEYLSKQNWTEQQKNDFAEGVNAYHEFAQKNSMPKTDDWADKKLDGYMYEEDRLRQQRLLAKKKIGCAFCGKSEAPYVVALPDGKELSFCDDSCACQYSCREGLYFDADDKRFYNTDEEARETHALDNISQKARDFLDNNAPVTSAEPAKEEYQKPEVLDAPPTSANAKPATPLLTPKEIVTIGDNGKESRCVGYALSMFATHDDVVNTVVAAMSYKYNSIMDIAYKLIQAAKQYK